MSSIYDLNYNYPNYITYKRDYPMYVMHDYPYDKYDYDYSMPSQSPTPTLNSAPTPPSTPEPEPENVANVAKVETMVDDEGNVFVVSEDTNNKFTFTLLKKELEQTRLESEQTLPSDVESIEDLPYDMCEIDGE